ncbi:hypothetical protein [Rhodalgimonas zhirmunskyi]|uniref:C-type lysozyme inhibitor domain-containing protein n=1 Tax=Rhodalgimonas zhirmunskyi TaxID=2964767 RepID=A0AAJ1U8Q8_9RHOB|nr:hypothetical protein [Rhodoalgimonas zhirmunskyi]MDQ2094850.1 hypothetical protein [Rhodoalgimonas zhirmunskyi]
MSKTVFTLLTSAGLILASPALADELTGAALVSALSGKSFSCTAEGKKMTMQFAQAKKNGSVSYKGVWGGRSFKSEYRLSKKGRYSNQGRGRKISTDGKGHFVFTGAGVPKAVCVVAK